MENFRIVHHLDKNSYTLEEYNEFEDDWSTFNLFDLDYDPHLNLKDMITVLDSFLESPAVHTRTNYYFEGIRQ